MIHVGVHYAILRCCRTTDAQPTRNRNKDDGPLPARCGRWSINADPRGNVASSCCLAGACAVSPTSLNISVWGHPTIQTSSALPRHLFDGGRYISSVYEFIFPCWVVKMDTDFIARRNPFAPGSWTTAAVACFALVSRPPLGACTGD